ncbi:sensor histidine kinase [Kitasatospora sp. GP82]|uniref:sensor histidine kinase n=1 Tax=Kitasatospora sp. GP82 TaxID=3035089 RepID=UPI0024749529|nr:sensor histidine kinase [Kitasatospora sp. GP82]MDH6123595.1 signal transduction histidine kinase [Kitasatospora sp. GP82]
MDLHLQPPLLGLAARRLVIADAGVAAVLAAILLCNASGSVHPAEVVMALASVGAVAVRRLSPVATLAVTIAGLAVTEYGGLAAFVGVALALTSYTAAARPARASFGMLAATVAVVFATGALGHPTDFRDHLGLVAFSLASMMLSSIWTVSWCLFRGRAYNEALREHAEQRAHAAVSEARRTVVEERLRLARELHDVVGHSMSIIAIQSGVARHVIATQPEEAAKSLAAIQETSRTVLRELRLLLGVLRDSDEVEYTPGGLDELPRLVDEAQLAGVKVELTTEGDSRRLTRGLDLAAFRIVQEGLTNVIKHADADWARVTVTYRDTDVVVEVLDHGRGLGPGQPVRGHGLVGVRERVALYGGDMVAEKVSPLGFRLMASLPTESPTEPVASGGR